MIDTICITDTFLLYTLTYLIPHTISVLYVSNKICSKINTNKTVRSYVDHHLISHKETQSNTHIILALL